MQRLDRLNSRDRWAVAALGCVLVTFPALLIGSALDVYALLWWGVATAYLGISWLLPGAFAGAAATQWGKDRGVRRPNALGFTVGPIVSVGLLVLVATILAVFQGDRVEQERETRVDRKPAVGDRRERVSLVMQAARRNRRFGPVLEVLCERDREGWCVVTYQAPACQLWEVVNVDGSDTPSPIGGTPTQGERGTLDEGPARYWIGCS